MNKEIESLKSTIKRKYSFKYNPDYSETIKTEIKESQIIPLAIETIQKLDWLIVYSDKNSIEAKRKNDFDRLTEKITITKRPLCSIHVHSKSLLGNFSDFGNNSKRTGLFIALFKNLEQEYKANGKLVDLENEYEKENSWTEYEVPSELPKPIKFGDPNLVLSIVGGTLISILFGLILGFLTSNFTYIIGLYEVGIGIGIGYLFGQVLKKTNYINFRSIQFILGGMVLVTFITSQYVQFYIASIENNLVQFNFIDFMRFRWAHGLKIKDLDVGSIGLLISWLFQLVFPFILAQGKVAGITMSHAIDKIPEKVIEYTIFLAETGNSESTIRAKLAQRGWNKKSDQDEVFDALGAISGFQENNRE